MIRNLTKPALFVLGLGTLTIFGLATLVVLFVAIQKTHTSPQFTPASFQASDSSAQNGIGIQAESSEAQNASVPQSRSYGAQSAAYESSVAQARQYAPASYSSAASGSGSGADWMQQAAPDGSATLSLPANWRIADGRKGAVEIQGPGSEQLMLGFQTFVTSGQAPYMAPEQALAWFMRSHSIQLLGIQNREAQRAASGQAELIVADSQMQGQRYKLIARVTTAPIGMGNWMLQISSMGAPADHFDADFPTMQKIWNSWKLDNGYVQGGFQTAARINQQTATMAANHAMNRMNSWNNFNESWDQTIRGVSTMENQTLGKRYETQIGTEQQFVDNCTRRGQDCRQVPVNQLVQPQ